MKKAKENQKEKNKRRGEEKTKNKRKYQKGITLIALVITIIILLILVGISIATLTGENGILTKMMIAKESTERAEAEEQVKIAVLGSYDESGVLNLRTLNDNLRKIEKLTYEGAPIGETENRIEKLPAVVNVNGYDVNIDESVYTAVGETGKDDDGNGILASEVLKVDTDNKKSSYIIYPAKNGEKILCQVLYDADSEYGLQIVTVNPVDAVTLGCEDPTVNLEDFPKDVNMELSDDVKRSIMSYNNVIKRLNEKSEEYINTKYTDVGKARCVGSNPNFEELSGDNVMVEREWLQGLSGKIKDTYQPQGNDYNQLKSINADKVLYNYYGSNYWKPRRIFFESGDSMRELRVECCNGSSGGSQFSTLLEMRNGKWEAGKSVQGLRVVFALKSNVKVIDNGKDGLTPETAYEIENEEKVQLASDVLKLKEGIGGRKIAPMVMYPKKDGSEMLCAVLYEADSDYGLQLVSMSGVGSVTLGSNDETVEGLDFEYNGEFTMDEQLKKSIKSYNNAIKKLNDEAEKYLNSEYTEEGHARCVGSNPKFDEKNVESEMYIEEEEDFKKYNLDGLFRKVDLNYELDYNRLIELGIYGGKYWLPSRNIVYKPSVEAQFFYVRWANGNKLDEQGIFRLYKNGTSGVYSPQMAIRPVLGLKSSVKVVSGDGTNVFPYRLALE